MTTMLYQCQSLPRAVATSSASIVARARPMQLPHLALQQHRYKSALALRAIPIISCSLIHHQHKQQLPLKQQQQQQFINSTSPHPRYTSTYLTHTLSTRELYTSPETNIMGIEIPTEQWAQVVEKIGGRKWCPHLTVAFVEMI